MPDANHHPVVAICGATEPSPVRVAAAARGWLPMPATPWRATLRALMQRPELALAVMDMDGSVDDGVRLLEALHRGWRRVHVLAVAQDHGPALEARARAAGVTAYLPAADPDTICHAASELLARLPVSVHPTTPAVHENRSGAPPGVSAGDAVRAGPRRGPPPDV